MNTSVSPAHHFNYKTQPTTTHPTMNDTATTTVSSSLNITHNNNNDNDVSMAINGTSVLLYFSSSMSWGFNDTNYNGTTPSYGLNTTIWEDRIASFYDDKLRPAIGMAVGILGLPSIALLIAVTWTQKYRKYSYSLYLTVMSVYDFLLILSESSDNTLLIYNGKYVRDYVTSDFPCRLYEHLFYVMPTISIWLNVAMAVDRYIVIAFPFKKDTFCNRRNSWIVCGGLIFIVHSIGILYIYYGKVEYFPDYGYFCNGEAILKDLDVILTYIGGVFASIIGIFIFTTMSVVKLLKIKQKRLKMTSQQPGGGAGAKDKTSRATMSLVGIGVCAFITQIPYVTNEMVRLYAQHNDDDLYRRLWYEPTQEYNMAVKIFEGFSFVINIQNFYVLFILNQNFRNDVFAMFSCFRKNSRKNTTRSKSMVTATTTTTKSTGQKF